VIDFVGACLAAQYQYNLHPQLPTTPDVSNPLELAFTLRIAYGGMACDEAFMGRLLDRRSL
jgi:hypothetical protein